VCHLSMKPPVDPKKKNAKVMDSIEKAWHVSLSVAIVAQGSVIEEVVAAEIGTLSDSGSGFVGSCDLRFFAQDA